MARRISSYSSHATPYLHNRASLPEPLVVVLSVDKVQLHYFLSTNSLFSCISLDKFSSSPLVSMSSVASSATRMFFPISFFTCLLGFLFLPLLFNLTRLFPRAPRRTCQHGRAGNETVRCPHFLLLLSFDLLCNSWLSLFPTQLR